MGYGWSWFLCQDRPFPGVTFRKEFTRSPFSRSQRGASSSLVWWEAKSHCWFSYFLLMRRTLSSQERVLRAESRAFSWGCPALGALGRTAPWLCVVSATNGVKVETRQSDSLETFEWRGQAFLGLWVHPAPVGHSSPGEVWEDQPSPFWVDVEEAGDDCEAEQQQPQPKPPDCESAAPAFVRHGHGLCSLPTGADPLLWLLCLPGLRASCQGCACLPRWLGGGDLPLDGGRFRRQEHRK